MVQVVSRSGDEMTLEVTVPVSGSLLDMEAAILEATALGRCATDEALGRYDTKVCQSPYGEVQVERFVYQTLCRGCVYCPLAHQDLIVHGATPRFASQLSHTYAQLNVRAVQCDLEQNYGRKVARSYMQNAAEYVGTIAMAKEGALAAAAGRSYRQHRHQPRRGHDPDG